MKSRSATNNQFDICIVNEVNFMPKDWIVISIICNNMYSVMMYVCVYIRMCVHMNVCTCVRMYVRVVMYTSLVTLATHLCPE